MIIDDGTYMYTNEDEDVLDVLLRRYFVRLNEKYVTSRWQLCASHCDHMLLLRSEDSTGR